MVALEALSATTPPKVPLCEEEGRAKGHGVSIDLQGAVQGTHFPTTPWARVRTIVSKLPKLLIYQSLALREHHLIVCTLWVMSSNYPSSML